VVWDAVDPGDDRLMYCQIPRTAGGCTNTKALTPPLEAIGRVSHVFAPGGGRILIASVRCCGTGEGTHVLESTDGGLSFGPPRQVGDYERASEIAFGPGQALLSASTGRVQHSPLSGPVTTAEGELNVGFTVPTDGAIGTHKATTPVFVHSDDDDITYHVGNPAGNLNDPASWAGPTVLPGGGEVEMESNPRGLELLQEGGKPGKRFWATRMFDGTGFTTLNQMTEAGDPIFASVGGTPFNGGSFHAVWVDNRTPNRLRWARSPNGFNWSESYVAFSGDEADEAFNIRIAGAGDGRAFAVWDENSNSGDAKGILLPPKGAGPPIDAVRVAQYEFSYSVPFPCTPTGSKVNVGIGVKSTSALPKNKSVNVSQVRFTLAKSSLTDTKPPFKASFPSDDRPVGSSHALRAFISYKPLTGGKTKVATLKATGLICP
jgi:hypothetical protein